MPNSYVNYTATSGQTVFGPVTFTGGNALSLSHIKAYVNGNPVTATVTGPLTGPTVTLASGAASGNTVTIKRETPYLESNRVVTFSDGDVLTASDLNLAGLNAMYAAQEAVDRSNDISTSVTGAVTSFNGRAGIVTAQANDYTASMLNHTSPLNNAISRTVASKLDDVISVKDFGAVGDGVTDDTTAFTNAVSAAGTRSVFVPGGSYKITGTVTGSFYADGAVTIVGGTVNTITLCVNASNNRVGIGTASPINNLHVHEPAAATGAAIRLTAAASGTSNTDGMSVGFDSSLNGYVWMWENSDLRLATNSTERMRITAGGDINVVSGNVVMSSGKGIDFSATTSGTGTMTSELLNDYEEGTWTPTLTFGGASSGIAYVTQVGSYTKIGRMVFACCHIALSSKGSSTGTAQITGLPFTSQASQISISAGSCTPFAVTFADQLFIRILNNTAVIELLEQTNAGTQSAITNTDFVNTSVLSVAITYIA